MRSIPASISLPASIHLEQLEVRIAPAADLLNLYNGVGFQEADNHLNQYANPGGSSNANLSYSGNADFFLNDTGGGIAFASNNREVLVRANTLYGGGSFGVELAQPHFTDNPDYAFAKGTYSIAGLFDLDGEGSFATSGSLTLGIDKNGNGTALFAYDSGAHGKGTLKGTYTMNLVGDMDLTLAGGGKTYEWSGQIGRNGNGIALAVADNDATPAFLEQGGAYGTRMGNGLTADNLPNGVIYKGFYSTDQVNSATTAVMHEVKIILGSDKTFTLFDDTTINGTTIGEGTTGTWTIDSKGAVSLKSTTALPFNKFSLSADLETGSIVDLGTSSSPVSLVGFLALSSASDKELVISHKTNLLTENGDWMTVSPGKAELTVTHASVVAIDNDNVTSVEYTPLMGSIISEIHIDPTAATGATLSVSLPSGATATIQKILTTDDVRHDVASISLGKGIKLGEGLNNSTVDLLVSGKLGSLKLDDVANFTRFSWGTQLSDADALTNRPNVTADNIGGDVRFLLHDNNTYLGGGGMGNLTATSAGDELIIFASTSIGNITIKTGDLHLSMQVDPNSATPDSIANVGTISVTGGDFDSDAIKVEGKIAGIETQNYSGGMTIGSIGSLATISASAGAGGTFSGTITITDDSAPTAPSFTVPGDFTGIIQSKSSIGNMTVKGDFLGTINMTDGADFGSITAESFDGATIDVDGKLGVLKATKVKDDNTDDLFTAFANLTITVTESFGGFSASISNLLVDTTALLNVTVTAKSIGNTSLTLKAATSGSSLDFIGMSDVHFTANGTENGKIGSISVVLSGGDGLVNATGIFDSTFVSTNSSIGNILVDVSSSNNTTTGVLTGIDIASTTMFTSETNVGSITVKTSAKSTTGGGATVYGVHGHGTGDKLADADGSVGNITISASGGSTSAWAVRGETDIAIVADGNIGNIKMTGSKVQTAATAGSAMNVTIDSSSKIGSFTFDGKASGVTQATGLTITANDSIGAVTVKTTDSVKTDADFVGTIKAGDDFNGLTTATTALQKKEIALNSLGGINVQGDLVANAIFAGGNIGAITVGGSITDTTIAAGVLNAALANGGFRHVSIGAVTIKGSIATSSISAGVNFGDDDQPGGNGGNGDFVPDLNNAALPSPSIGAIVISGFDNGGSDPIIDSLQDTQTYIIQAAAIKSLKIGTSTINIPDHSPFTLDANNNQSADDTEIGIRLL